MMSDRRRLSTLMLLVAALTVLLFGCASLVPPPPPPPPPSPSPSPGGCSLSITTQVRATEVDATFVGHWAPPPDEAVLSDGDGANPVRGVGVVPEQAVTWSYMRSAQDREAFGHLSVLRERRCESLTTFLISGMGPPPTPEPTSPPPATCPEGAPPPNKIKLEGRRLASLIVDGTVYVHSQEFCAAINGQLDCPYGDESPEGWAQRRACDALHGPYRWSFQGIACDDEPKYDPAGKLLSTCWLNLNAGESVRNPLQIRIAGPPTILGVVEACTVEGVCSRADCSFQSPVCQMLP